jgi:pimeloyl-ACP methyl ester carboxylesterase
MEPNERFAANGKVKICCESFGNPGNPPLILIMGATASMIWWDSEFCERLAKKGFFVIRYDNRDVGKSTTYAPGEPPYSTLDMASDLLAVMDAYQLKSANLVGMSLGGMLAQIVAILHPEQVKTITLIASGIWDDKPELPSIDKKILDYHTTAANIDWGNKIEIISYLVGGWRILNGSRHSFDEARASLLAETEVDRTNSLLSMFNHSQLRGGEELYGKSDTIKAPTLIIHGTEGPVLPFAHAIEMNAVIPGSKLFEIQGGGHEIHPNDWDLIVEAITKHVIQ